LDSVYSVTLGAREHANRLVVKNDAVTFESGDLTVDELSFHEPSPQVDNARQAITSGAVLTNNHALIGESLRSAVDLQFYRVKLK